MARATHLHDRFVGRFRRDRVVIRSLYYVDGVNFGDIGQMVTATGLPIDGQAYLGLMPDGYPTPRCRDIQPIGWVDGHSGYVLVEWDSASTWGRAYRSTGRTHNRTIDFPIPQWDRVSAGDDGQGNTEYSWRAISPVIVQRVVSERIVPVDIGTLSADQRRNIDQAIGTLWYLDAQNEPPWLYRGASVYETPGDLVHIDYFFMRSAPVTDKIAITRDGSSAQGNPVYPPRLDWLQEYAIAYGANNFPIVTVREVEDVYIDEDWVLPGLNQ
jgi:hypothetical protein